MNIEEEKEIMRIIGGAFAIIVIYLNLNPFNKIYLFMGIVLLIYAIVAKKQKT